MQRDCFLSRNTLLAVLTCFCSLFVFLGSAQPVWAQDAEEIEKYGDILQVAIPATALGMTRGDTEGRWMLCKSFASTMLTTYALKHTVREERPESEATTSFPSGHTAAAFSGASFIQRRYGWWPGAPSYLLASYVGYSRVRADAHYPRDVVAGAVLATAFTYYFTDPYSGVSLEIIHQKGRRGLRLSFAF